ncbi:MAG: hypothetical protein U0Q22_11400 [Acidimicrobiales bacterium]
MTNARRLRWWRPHGRDLVRIRFGRRRGAHGIVRTMRSRFGTTVVEILDDPTHSGDIVELPAWWLAPPRVDIDLRSDAVDVRTPRESPNTTFSERHPRIR